MQDDVLRDIMNVSIDSLKGAYGAETVEAKCIILISGYAAIVELCNGVLMKDGNSKEQAIVNKAKLQ